MNEIMKLQKNNKKQNQELNLLWQQLIELQNKFQQRNNAKAQCFQDRFTYSIFLMILPFLYLQDVLKLRQLNKFMKEIITNFLSHYRLEQSIIIEQLEIEIQEEKEKLPIIYYEILEELIKRATFYVQEINKLNKNLIKQIPAYSPLLIMQVAECEGIELFKIKMEELRKLKSYLLFLDFSKHSDQKKKQLLELYQSKLEITNQMEKQMNETERLEIQFSRLAKMWLKQTYYQDTYEQYRLIMILVKRKEYLKWLVRQLEILEKKKIMQRID